MYTAIYGMHEYHSASEFPGCCATCEHQCCLEDVAAGGSYGKVLGTCHSSYINIKAAWVFVPSFWQICMLVLDLPS